MPAQVSAGAGAGKRKRPGSATKSSASSPTPQSVPVPPVQPGDNLLKLIQPKSNGGVVHRIQPLFVPELIARCGMRWWNAETNDNATSILRRVVIDHNIGGYGPVYDALRDKDAKMQLKVLQHLRLSQQHTAPNHMKATSALIAKLFRATPDPQEANVNYVKKAVFGVEDGGPILPANHPVYAAMEKALKGASSILYFIQL